MLRRIKNKTLCHAELVSASQDVETQPHGGQAHKAHTSPVRFVKRVQGDIRIEHKPFCHSELGSESHKCIEVKSSIPSYHSAEQNNPVNCFVRGFCGIFKNLKKAFAFTLAETLIVMGIIGVVAALTIPNLNSSTADKEKIAKLQKIYSNLNDAFGRAEAVYGPFAEWQDDASVFFDRMGDFLKMTKKNEAYPVTPKDLNGAASRFIAFPGYYYVLPDGAVIIGESSSEDAIGDNHTMDIFIDLDGVNKGAGTYGKDLFVFKAYSIENRGIRPLGEEDANSNLTNLKNDCFKSGETCSSWVIKYGNMDYLKADRTGKCPNGKTLDITTNISCK